MSSVVICLDKDIPGDAETLERAAKSYAGEHGLGVDRVVIASRRRNDALSRTLDKIEKDRANGNCRVSAILTPDLRHVLPTEARRIIEIGCELLTFDPDGRYGRDNPMLPGNPPMRADTA